MKHRERIVQIEGVCGGQPVFKGTRVPLRPVLDSLAEGATTDEILASFPNAHSRRRGSGDRLCGGIGCRRHSRPPAP